MSSLKIEERFSVSAPMERVWRFLLDPEGIAPCLPGAELLEVEDERTFHGQMKVKVGPVTVAYKGTIELSEIDETARRIQMVGKGKEKGGAGSAKMTMDCQLGTDDDGAVTISVDADVQLAGRIVRFGRGMIQSVSAQLFKQFAGNVQASIEGADGDDEDDTDGEVAGDGDDGDASAAGGDGAAGAASGGGESSEPETDGDGDSDGAAAAGGDSATADDAEADSASESSSGAAAPARNQVKSASATTTTASGEIEAIDTVVKSADDELSADAVELASAERRAATVESSKPKRTSQDRRVVRQEAEPVRALPLLFRALWDVIKGFFRGLLGRK
ncbi:MAG: hypothetical protein Tsb0020_35530 [Haliangiales bacterium]